MGKKKFIDKKKAATFQLFARDSSDPNYSNAPGSDRVFIRVDNNPVSFNTVFDEDNHCYNNTEYNGEEDSIFADAPDDNDDGNNEYMLGHSSSPATNEKDPLPENVRKEILELGFPDDGYNYLIHVREIRNTGGGSAFYHNPKFKPDQLPHDVKAYDASRVQLSKLRSDYNEKSIYSVASKILNARMPKVVDPEVAALLDDGDLSRFGSDAEDLEEDFVVRANMAEEGEGDESNKKSDLVEESEVINEGVKEDDSDSGNQPIASEVWNHQAEEKPRVRRVLDEQFDILELQEYGTDDDEYEGYVAEQEEEFLADKLKHVLNENDMKDLELDDKYKAPADLLHGSERPISKDLVDSAAAVMRRCAEYAEKYENESEDEKVVVEQESSDESEQFDCESIISTYSTLDNHPGKIEAPEIARKKKLAETISGALSGKSQVISLRGKEKLPVDFLRNGRNYTTENVKSAAGGLKPEQLRRKQHGQETKEEKKERKAAVKKERHEARQMKKSMKELYRSEAQQAQKVAAIAGPSSIRLM